MTVEGHRLAVHRGFFARALRSPNFIAGGIMLLLLVAAAVLAPAVAPYDPAEQNLTAGLLSPSIEHLFGTDQLGRDILSRMLFAARTGLGIAVVTAILPFVAGIILGIVSGYFGTWVDYLIGRFIDTVIAFPFYVILVALAFALGAGPTGIFVAFALVGWVGYARVVRTAARTLRASGWIEAARGGGLSHARILFRHLLPNVAPQAVVLLMTEIVLILVAIVTLGYLGLGVQPPTPDWGTMIAEGQSFITTKWWVSALPGLGVIYTGIALSLFGDGLADAWRVKR